MLKSFVVLLLAYQGTLTKGQPVEDTDSYRDGSCPALSGSLAETTTDFDASKLEGIWKQVVGTDYLLMGNECLTMRINQPLNFLNKPFYLRQTVGKPRNSDKMLMGEDIFMTFSHPNITTAFGSLVKDDLKALRDVSVIENLQQSVKNMKPDQRQLLSEMQLTQYREQMYKVQLWKEQFDKDLYADNEQIADTDYESYITFYSCSEFTQELNEDGLTKQEVDKLILDATLNGNEKPHVSNVFFKSTKHRVNVQIFVKDIEDFDSEQLSNLEQRLVNILGGYDIMEDHVRTYHDPNCVTESTNVFKELDAKRQIDWYKGVLEKEKEIIQ